MFRISNWIAAVFFTVSWSILTFIPPSWWQKVIDRFPEGPIYDMFWWMRR